MPASELKTHLLLVHTALRPEAVPLIDNFRLKKIVDWKPFEFFQRDNIYLAISSIGRVKTAAALAAAITQIRSQHQQAVTITILNIGIAGSRKDLAIGTLVHAVRVNDLTSKQSFYPDHLIIAPGLPVVVNTADAPQDETTCLFASGVVDMEASAVFEVARLYSTSSRVQALKIVSDHLRPQDISAQYITKLVEQHTQTICKYAECLLAPELERPFILEQTDIELLESLTSSLKLTRSQRTELEQRAKYVKLEKQHLPDLSSYLDLKPKRPDQRNTIFKQLIGSFV